jgi:hypothetical protein
MKAVFLGIALLAIGGTAPGSAAARHFSRISSPHATALSVGVIWA